MKKLLSLCLMVFCTTLLIAQKTSYDLPAGYDRANHEFTDKTPKSFSDHILPEGTRTMRSDFSEGFDDILLLPPLGWALINNSNPVGTTGWFQGSPGVFAAHSGDPDSYIGANFNNTAGVGTISNWLLTPEISMSDGDVITFWTRTATGSTWADRLQLRLSTNGNSTDVGTLATDVGDFSTLLLDINPTLIGNGYPQTWTQYSVTLSGIGEDVDGRIAFRYFVTNGGPAGANSNYIGIDTFSYESNGEEPPPPPPAYCDAGPTTLNDSNVERVLISGENDTEIDHTGCPGVLGVEDLTHLSVDLTRGETYTLEVTFGTCGSAFPGAGSVWIDWGQDFEFDPADLIHESTGTPGTAPWDGPVTISFTVPANAELGNTVMRVMQREFGSLPLDPCGTFPWGSVMDFGITVIDAVEEIIAPFDLAITTESLPIGNALFTWNHPEILIKDSTRDFVGFDVFLDDMDIPVETGLSDGVYLFEGLAAGSYTAGVRSVYDDGTSDVITLDFEILEIIAPFDLAITTESPPIGNALFTWDHPEISSKDSTRDFLGFDVFLGGILEETGLSGGEYLFVGLAAGSYTAGVRSVYDGGTSDIITLDFEIEEEPPFVDLPLTNWALYLTILLIGVFVIVRFRKMM